MIVVELRYGWATTPFMLPTVPTFSGKTHNGMVNSDGRNHMIFRMFGPLNYNIMTDIIYAILTVVCAILIYIMV